MVLIGPYNNKTIHYNIIGRYITMIIFLTVANRSCIPSFLSMGLFYKYSAQ